MTTPAFPSTCPYCGAAVRPNSGSDRPCCVFCGAPLPVVKQAPITQPDSLSEYRHLPRPKPQSPRQAMGCLLFFGIIWTLFSAVFAIIGVGTFLNEQNRYRRLLQEGVTVSAGITKLEIDDSGDSTSYFVYYRFTAPVKGAPLTIDAHTSVSSSIYYTLKTGQAIDILYVASDPNISTLKAAFGPPQPLLSLAFAGMGGLFFLFGLGMVYGSIKAIVEWFDLRTHGHMTQAVIFERWQDTDSDGDATYFVAYAFRAGPQRQMITHAEQNHKLYKHYQIGDRVPVRYLPDEPTICQVWL